MDFSFFLLSKIISFARVFFFFARVSNKYAHAS